MKTDKNKLDSTKIDKLENRYGNFLELFNELLIFERGITTRSGKEILKGSEKFIQSIRDNLSK